MTYPVYQRHTTDVAKSSGELIQIKQALGESLYPALTQRHYAGKLNAIARSDGNDKPIIVDNIPLIVYISFFTSLLITN